jgi:xanthine dehydrogenase accessory factor
MLVLEDGRTLGTIGGGCYENDAFQRARAAMRDNRPELVHYDLSDDFAEETGLICGGQMDVFIEPVTPPPELFVVGAGHIGFHVARMAAACGFRVHVLDDREKFANPDRFPDAAEVVVDDIPAWLGRARIPANAYVVIATRGHRHDLDALRAVASRDLRYLGLIGSRAKVARLYEQVLAQGDVAADTLRRIHSPIGLDIGAVTPEEIAVAIVAELIAVKYGKVIAGARDPSARPLQWTPPSIGADDTPRRSSSD